MHWSVMHVIPNEPADDSVCTFVGLRCFNDLFLNRRQRAPGTSHTASVSPIGTCDEASIVRSQRRCEHASSPRPVE